MTLALYWKRLVSTGWRPSAGGGLGVALVALALAGAAALPANSASAAPMAAGQQALFSRMMADPGNVDLALKYAEASAQAGDLEGAVSTLERLLIFAPQVARLNYELGVLYYRLGAYAAASGYFTAAQSAADASPEIKAQAATYLARATSASAPDRTSASIAIGARYQTNANGGAGSSLVDLNGVPFQLNSAAMADADSNAFVSGVVHATHDLASQGDRFDIDLSFYGAPYLKHTEINTLAADLRAGPVFNLQRFSIPRSTLQLYGVVGGVALAGDPYDYSVGGGALLTTAVDPKTLAHVRLESRYEQFMDSARRPNVSDMTGARTRLSADLKHQATDWASFYGSVYGERKMALAGDSADWEAGAALGGIFALNLPALGEQGHWSLDLSAGILQRNFDANDPVISTNPRQDRQVYLQGSLTVPLAPSWSAVGTVGYQRQLSTYDLYTYDNVSGSLAVVKGF